MINTEFLRQLNRFSLIIRKKVTSNYAGGRKSTARGRGISIKDFREYVRGDDIRAIDWKLYGRSDKLYVRQYEEERTLTAHVILDYSTSMNFGEKTTKFDYGAMIGIGVAYMAMKDNDKFEFTTFSADMNMIKPRKGASHLASIVDILNKLNVKGVSNFEDCMRKYRKHIHGKSLVLVLSDFLFNLEEIKKGLLRLGKHEIIVIQVLDRQEKDLKLEGDVKLFDSESNEVIQTYMSKRLREKYQQKLNEHSSNIHDICSGIKAKFFQVTTDELIFDNFYKIMRRN